MRGTWAALMVVAFLGLATAASAGLYNTLVLSDDPVAYWRLDESSTAQPAANSASGASSAGTAANGAYTAGVGMSTTGLIAGDLDTAITTHDSDRMATLGFEKFAGGTGFTVEYWVKANALQTGMWTNLVGDAPDASFDLMNYLQNTGIVSAHVYTSAGVGNVQSSYPITIGKTYHVVSTYDSGTGKLNLYMNGAQVGPTATSIGTLLYTANPIFIGKDNREQPGPAAGIVLDEVAIYNKPLTQAQIINHAMAGGLSFSSVSLSTSVLGYGTYNNNYNNNATGSTVELVRAIGNSDASPYDITYNQAGATINFAPYVMGGNTGGNLGSDVHGRDGANIWQPGAGDTNSFHAGLGCHANWLITYDLADIRTQWLAGTNLALQFTGRAGMNGNIGVASPPSGIAQAGVWIDGVLLGMSPLLSISGGSGTIQVYDFNLELSSEARFLTLAFLNGDASSAWDDISIENATLTVLPEPASLALLGAGLAVLARRRRR